MFGIGAIAGPLIAKPFLVNTDSPELVDQHATANITQQVVNREDLMVQWPYVITSVYTFITVSCLAMVYFRTRKSDTTPTKLTETVVDTTKVNAMWRLVVIIVSTIFCHFYFALQLVSGTFLMAYVVKCDLHVDKSSGALMNSLFWVTFTVFRLPSIWIMKKIGLEKSIIVNLVITVFANIVLVPFGNSNIYALWIGMALIGK